MRRTLSYDHAINSIKLIYKSQGFELKGETLGQQVYEEFGRPVGGTHLGALYAFVDEQVALWRLLSWFFTSAIVGGRDQKSAATFYQLSISHMRTLASIRLLCGCGFDVNARQVLRNLYENSLVWGRLSLDAQAILDYRSATTPELANGFWHRYISKKKTEKFLLANAKNQQWIAGWIDLAEEFDARVGPAAHPSFLAGTFDATHDFRDQGETLAISEPGRSSHFTLSHAIVWGGTPIADEFGKAFECQTSDFLAIGAPFNCIPHPTKSWDEYNMKIRAVMAGIVMMAARFTERLRTGEVGDPIDS